MSHYVVYFVIYDNVVGVSSIVMLIYDWLGSFLATHTLEYVVLFV